MEPCSLNVCLSREELSLRQLNARLASYLQQVTTLCSEFGVMKDEITKFPTQVLWLFDCYFMFVISSTDWEQQSR